MDRKSTNLLKRVISVLMTIVTTVMTTATRVFAAQQINVNQAAQKVMDFIFNAMFMGGLVMIAMGVYQIAKAVSEGEAAPPNAIPKALGFLISGIVLCAMKSILNLMGIQVDGFTLI